MVYQFYHNTFYTKKNLLDDKTRNQLMDEIDDHLDNVNNYNQNGEYLEHALGLGSRKIKNSVCWFNLFKAIKKEKFDRSVRDIDRALQTKKFDHFYDEVDTTNTKGKKYG